METEASRSILDAALVGPALTLLVTAVVGGGVTYWVHVAKQSRSDALATDRKLFQESIEILPSNSRAIEFIHERQFLRKFYISDLRPLEQLSEILSRPDKQFHNRRLESIKRKFNTALANFLEVTNSANHVGPHEHLYSFLKPDEQDDFTEESPETQDKLKSLETLAKSAHEAYLDYLHTGQKILKP